MGSATEAIGAGSPMIRPPELAPGTMDPVTIIGAVSLATRMTTLVIRVAFLATKLLTSVIVGVVAPIIGPSAPVVKTATPNCQKLWHQSRQVT